MSGVRVPSAPPPSYFIHLQAIDLIHLLGVSRLHALPLAIRGFLGRTLVVTSLFMCLSASVFGAGNVRPTPSNQYPDVLVQVLDGLGSFDRVSVNYTTAVSREDAQEDVDNLVKLTSWMVRNEVVTTQADRTPGSTPTTSVAFDTAPLVNAREGTLPVEQFVSALKRFKIIQVNYYLMGPKLAFRGIQDFEDQYVKITLGRPGNSYQYHVLVKDNSFDRLDLQKRPAGQRRPGCRGERA